MTTILGVDLSDVSDLLVTADELVQDATPIVQAVSGQPPAPNYYVLPSPSAPAPMTSSQKTGLWIGGAILAVLALVGLSGGKEKNHKHVDEKA
jgi:hypothetical protein